MQTASFFNAPRIGRISIARSAPRGYPAGYKVCRELAPGSWFRSASHAQYCDLYETQLNRLDPQAVFDNLCMMVDDNEPVLLCWEKPPLHTTNWCHRRMVAEWFWLKLKIEIPEVDFGMVNEFGQAVLPTDKGFEIIPAA